MAEKLTLKAIDERLKKLEKEGKSAEIKKIEEGLNRLKDKLLALKLDGY